MQNHTIFSYYKNLVPFLHDVLGPKSEILLHDISKPEASIVALAGNLSNRNVGGPLTDMALKQLKNKKYLTQPAVTNYKSYTVDGKTCRSSSFFIKDEDDTLIAMLCINILVSDLIEMRDLVDSMIGLSTGAISPNSELAHSNDEKLGQNLDDLMGSLIQDVLEKYDTSTKILSIQAKEEIITELNQKGVFLLKGGVAEVAKSIDMSEPSVYRYLAKIKQD